MTRPDLKTLRAWRKEVNDWYNLNASIEEVLAAFERAFLNRDTDEGESYVDIFLRCPGGSWARNLDTADRETLAKTVEGIRLENHPVGSVMTAGDLIKALQNFPEDAPVMAFCGCKAMSDIVDCNANGKAAQLNTLDARCMINKATPLQPK